MNAHTSKLIRDYHDKLVYRTKRPPRSRFFLLLIGAMVVLALPWGGR